MPLTYLHWKDRVYDEKDRPMPFWVVSFASRSKAEHAVRGVHRKKKFGQFLSPRKFPLNDFDSLESILVGGPSG